jgi:hypothetical protein
MRMNLASFCRKLADFLDPTVRPSSIVVKCDTSEAVANIDGREKIGRPSIRRERGMWVIRLRLDGPIEEAYADWGDAVEGALTIQDRIMPISHDREEAEAQTAAFLHDERAFG